MGMYRVVIIDDNKLIADALAAYPIWKENGCAVEAVCYDSTEGKRAIETVRPDIIITDIRMPGLSGLDLIDMVRGVVPKARVIFVSAYDQFEYAQRALRMGAQDYLLKPFSKETISDAVAGAVCYLDEHENNGVPGEAGSPLLKPIIAYINARIDQHVTAEEVARAFYMSTSRLDKLIQKNTGGGFQRLHISLRMKRAKELMKDVRNNIEDVAQKTGYKNYASFYRAFTREYSMPPTEYRELMQREQSAGHEDQE